MPLASFRITLEPGHPPVVEVDGEKLEGVEAVSAQAEHGRVPEVVLVMPAGEGTVLEGHANVSTAEPQDQREAVSAWLANIDPDELKRLVLARSDYGTGMAETVLDVLKELANGA